MMKIAICKILLIALLCLESFFCLSQQTYENNQLIDFKKVTTNTDSNILKPSADYLAKGYSPIKLVDKFNQNKASGRLIDMHANGVYLKESGFDGNKYIVFNKAGEKLAKYQHKAFYNAFKGKLYPDNSVVIANAIPPNVEVVHFMPDGSKQAFSVRANIAKGDDNRFTFSNDRKHLIIPTDKEILVVDIAQQRVIQSIAHNISHKIYHIRRNDADGFFWINNRTDRVGNILLTPDGKRQVVRAHDPFGRKINYFGMPYGAHTIIRARLKSNPSRVEGVFYNYSIDDAEIFRLPFDDLYPQDLKTTNKYNYKYSKQYFYLVTHNLIRVFDLKTKQLIARQHFQGFGRSPRGPRLHYYPENNLLRIKNIHTKQFFDFVMPQKVAD